MEYGCTHSAGFAASLNLRQRYISESLRSFSTCGLLLEVDHLLVCVSVKECLSFFFRGEDKLSHENRKENKWNTDPVHTEKGKRKIRLRREKKLNTLPAEDAVC